MRIKSIFTTLAFVALTGAASVVQASTIFYPTPDPFPNGSGFDLHVTTGEICVVAIACSKDFYITDLTLQSETATSHKGTTFEYTAGLYAAFTNPYTGAAMGSATLQLDPGTYVDITVDAPYNPLTHATGTFTDLLTAASFEGTDSYGDTITRTLGSTPSTGTVVISAVAGGFDITSGFTVYTAGTFNGVPTHDPAVSAVSTAPEPATWAMMLIGFAGVGTMIRRKAAYRTAA
jgi:hypothetical protein